MVETKAFVAVELSQHAAELLQKVQEQGGFASASEVLEEALRGWDDASPAGSPLKHEELHQICQAALADGRPGLQPAPVFARLERKFQSLTAGVVSVE